LNLVKEYKFELYQTENFSAEIVVRCADKCHEPRLTNLRDLMGYIVIVGNVQPAESGKTENFTRFYLERDIHEVTVISRYNPYLDEYLQVGQFKTYYYLTHFQYDGNVRLQIVQNASLNVWGKFFPLSDIDGGDDDDEVFPHLAMAIKTSKKVGRYIDFMNKNLKACDEELEQNGKSHRLATAVRNTKFPEFKKPTFIPKD